MGSIIVRQLEDRDREWAALQIGRQWGASMIVSKNKVYYPAKLPGFVAVQDLEKVGLATYNVEDGDCELVSIQTLREGHGIGSELLLAVRLAAEATGCRRLWLITTDDNLRALGFYQRRGMSLVAVYRNAMDAARKLKPEIPLNGLNRIPLRDEIELEMLL